MKVLMICLGNICRSPIAEAVFQDTLEKNGLSDSWEVDSAAIGSWHVGRKPDHRALKTMNTHGLSYSNKARQIKSDDFKKFDYIFGMDEENISDLKERAPSGSSAKILLLGDFDAQGERIIRDPYYDSGSDGFEKCYQQCVRACDGFLKKHSIMCSEKIMDIEHDNKIPNAKSLRILFVCIGNSCRSPMAESILKDIVLKTSDANEINWEIDSAALRSWNVGYPPEDRCIQVLAEHGLTSNHIARKIKNSDFYKFDYIFGMDDSNINELKELIPNDTKCKIELLGNYNQTNDRIILDPYFEAGTHGFYRCYEQITASCRNFVKIQNENIKTPTFSINV